MLKAIIAGAAILCLSSCAASTNILNDKEIAGLKIERVDVTFVARPEIVWGKAEQEFVDGQLAKKGPATKPKAPRMTDASESGSDPVSAEHQKIADSPEAKDYARTRLAQMVKQRMERDIVPEFKGTRLVRLEIEIQSFVIPSAAQRVVLGGTPLLLAKRALKDSKTPSQVCNSPRSIKCPRPMRAMA